MAKWQMRLPGYPQRDNSDPATVEQEIALAYAYAEMFHMFASNPCFASIDKAEAAGDGLRAAMWWRIDRAVESMRIVLDGEDETGRDEQLQVIAQRLADERSEEPGRQGLNAVGPLRK